ncbi:MAG: M48 family metallopeptidase [Dokdonella sp.]
MDFFAHQELARKQTRRMLVLFALAVAALVAATNVVILVGFGIAPEMRGQVIAAVSLGTLAVVGIASLYRITSLRGGGSAVAVQLGAVPALPGTGDLTYQRLRNVVEEIAIASGVPMPEVFVLEHEAGINAFAAGYTPADAAITVTRGALDKLTRSELQGVIAHEFSHVLNGDMRLNIRLIGVVFGIVVLAAIGRRILFYGGGRSRNRDSGGIAVVAIALLVLGWLGVVCARLIKASIARQREYLADASAVQFTRDNNGIAGALKKIGALSAGSKLEAADREEISHMLFGDGVGYSSLFATHPPLIKRIKRLLPRFDPAELTRISAAWENPVQVGDTDSEFASLAGFAPVDASSAVASSAASSLPDANAAFRLDSDRVTRQVGNPGEDDRSVANSISQSIPSELREAAETQEHAVALILALALGAGTTARDQGLALLADRYDTGTLQSVDRLSESLQKIHPLQRLPLAAMAFPTLRRRPRAQLDALIAALAVIIAADGLVSLAEYCLATLVRSQVIESLDPSSHAAIGRTRLSSLTTELANLYSIVAQHGHDDDTAASRAFQLGIEEAMPMSTFAYQPPSDWVASLDEALPKLDRLAPAGKELVVAGLVRAISSDGIVNVSEAELLRTICACLHCPLPPLLQR